MGIRIALVLMSTSFLLGTLMTHWIADSLTLWRSPLTDAHLWTAAAYYSLLSKMNVYMAAATVAIVTVGFMGLVLSFQDGQAENLMFDGASIFLYGISAAVYVYSAVPKLSKFTKLPVPLPLPPSNSTLPLSSPRFPSPLRQPTIELASSHLICAVALTGVLILQAAKYWADGEDDDGSLETRVDSSLGNWKRTKRPSVNEREAGGMTMTARRGSLSGEKERERRGSGSGARVSESPSTRRRSPVKRKPGSFSITR